VDVDEVVTLKVLSNPSTNNFLPKIKTTLLFEC
jgi:hypothetical protein